MVGIETTPVRVVGDVWPWGEVLARVIYLLVIEINNPLQHPCGSLLSSRELGRRVVGGEVWFGNWMTIEGVRFWCGMG